jgi:hypothetical protein
MMASSSSSKTVLSADLMDVIVDVPTIGPLPLHPGHASNIRRITGKADIAFTSTADVNDLYQKMLIDCTEAKHGTKANSLALMVRMNEYLRGARETPMSYDMLAAIWKDYCSERFYGKDNAMTAYGKAVAATIFVGQPKDTRMMWRTKPLSFPLHSINCDICHFLTTLVKNNPATAHKAPFAALDLKAIHDYFGQKGVFHSFCVLDDIEVLEHQPERPTTLDVHTPRPRRSSAVLDLSKSAADAEVPSGSCEAEGDDIEVLMTETLDDDREASVITFASRGNSRPYDVLSHDCGDDQW